MKNKFKIDSKGSMIPQRLYDPTLHVCVGFYHLYILKVH